MPQALDFVCHEAVVCGQAAALVAHICTAQVVQVVGVAELQAHRTETQKTVCEESLLSETSVRPVSASHRLCDGTRGPMDIRACLISCLPAPQQQ